MNGLNINKNKSKILSTWDSFRKSKKTKMILEMMILVLKMKNQSLKAVHNTVLMEMTISLEMKDLRQLLRKKKSYKGVKNKNITI